MATCILASAKSRADEPRTVEMAGNTAETAYLVRRRDQLGWCQWVGTVAAQGKVNR